jgi:hypothetical protein
MDPKVGLDGEVKGKLSFPCRESNPGHPGPSLVAIPTQLKKCIRLMVQWYSGVCDQDFQTSEPCRVSGI